MAEPQQPDNRTLLCGRAESLLAGLPTESVQLIITSPPYGIGKSYEKKMPLRDYVEWQAIILSLCVNVLNQTGSLCWQVGNYIDDGEIYPIDLLLYPHMNSMGLKLRNRIIWGFEHGLHATKRFSGRYETMLWFTKSNDYYFNLDAVRVPQKYPGKKHFKGPKKGQLSCNPLGKNPGDIWLIPNVKHNHVEKTSHPCQFPYEIAEKPILSMTKPGDLVVDPFMGSGTVGCVCAMTGRRFAGSDTKQEYVDLARERIALAEKGELKIRPSNKKAMEV